MIAGALAWVQGKALALMGGVLLAAVVLAGVQTWRVGRLKDDVAALSTKLADATEAARLSDALRGQEQAQDKASFADQSDRCEQRFNNALEAARAIEEVTNAQDVPAAAAAGRPIVDAGQLRRIIGQGGSGTPRMPAGSNGTPQP